MINFEETEKMMRMIYQCLAKIQFWVALQVVFTVLLIVVVFCKRK